MTKLFRMTKRQMAVLLLSLVLALISPRPIAAGGACAEWNRSVNIGTAITIGAAFGIGVIMGGPIGAAVGASIGVSMALAKLAGPKC